MSDAPTPDPAAPTSAVPGPGQELEVDLAAFLPEGVVLGEPDDEGVEVEELGVDLVETVIDTEDGVVVVDEIEAVVETEDGLVVVDEVIVRDAEGTVLADEVAVEAVVVQEAPPVDLDALTQIERDLDAVDAAIAALDAGTYGIDAATGQPIDDALLAEDPTRLS